MASEDLMSGAGARYIQMQSEPMPSTISSFFSFRQSPESTRIFDELPKATIVFVSRPDASDISPALLTYTIEFRYKQARSGAFSFLLEVNTLKFGVLIFCSYTSVQVAVNKESFTSILFTLCVKKTSNYRGNSREARAGVKEWLQNIGIGEHTAVVHDDDEPDEETVPLHHDESVKNRDIPSSAALPIIRPALGRQNSVSDRAKVAMQGYLNLFLGNLDIVNSREVCLSSSF
ncbi:Phospholipase D zeta 1 [Vitis vinifera]|uniref:Phospholipase D zeta 1 n=1 Tax=Vitis vinifera TaxID=29760 RepID=A0A438DWX8_VITVI|nr:Phospholipase D zeta 1 [Vitis vinifera]